MPEIDMAKSLAQFQTEFKAIQQLVGEHNQDIFGNAQLVAQTTGVISEGIKVLGERIQELRDEGRTGADIAAFKDDAEVTKFLGGIDDHLSSLERELTRITRLHQTDFAKTKARFVTLKRDVQAEIAARKKQVSTKLGLGNKSLPDLVKLLTALNTYQDGGAYSPFEVFTPEKMTEHKAIFDKRIKTEISKAKDVRLSEHQKMLQQQALSTRNLKGNLARAKTHMEAVELGVTKAKDALAQRISRDRPEDKLSRGRGPLLEDSPVIFDDEMQPERPERIAGTIRISGKGAQISMAGAIGLAILAAVILMFGRRGRR